MPELRSDLPAILGAFLVAIIGLISVVISLFRRRRGDHVLASFGLLAFTYGLRWLVETEAVRTLLGFPFNAPYLHALLTYILPIPLAGFLLQIFGRGLFQSMRLVYWSTIANAVVMVLADLWTGSLSSDNNINVGLVIVWCVAGIYNLAVARREGTTDLRVVRSGLLVLFLAITHDNLMSLGMFPWSFNVSNAGFLLLCLALGFVAVRHFVSNERTLLAVEQEIEIARRIQQSNLPLNLQTPPGCSIAARYIPMTAVAGDFYDVQVVEGRGVGMLIADVAGHGVGAALIGSMLKVGFAAQAAHLDDPGRVLTELNRILQGKVGDGFVTACAVYVELTDGTLRYANAGHPSPLLLRFGGEMVEGLPGGGTMLGPFVNLRYETQETRMGPGDRLVLYTDGLVEVRDREGTFFGEGRLKDALRFVTADSTEEAASALVGQVTAWSLRQSGSSLDDDLTLMVVDLMPT